MNSATDRPGRQLSVVIPIYLSSAILEPLCRRLMPALEATGLDYEAILVDDASPDNSWTVLEAIRAEYPDRVTLIQLAANVGQHAALLCGLRHSSGELVVTMDDDLQHPPEEIVTLVRAMDDPSLDMVYGRYREKRHAPWRNAGALFITCAYQWIFATRVRPTSFRILRRPLVDAICRTEMSRPIIDGLIALHTKRIGEQAVEHSRRFDGRSSYSLLKLFRLAGDLLLGYSRVVPRVLMGIGLALLGAAMLIGMALGEGASLGRSLAASLAAICGVAIFSIGIVRWRKGSPSGRPLRKDGYVVRRAVVAGSAPACPGADASHVTISSNQARFERPLLSR
jgi:glycosyltransferase involved in cell wall biosynthesis